MSEKVVLPREVAEAIDKVWRGLINHYDKKFIALTEWGLINARFGGDTQGILLNYFNDNPIKYMTALVNGYTVEQTKEERLLERYKRYTFNHNAAIKQGNSEGALHENSKKIGMRDALYELGITIPGIND